MKRIRNLIFLFLVFIVPLGQAYAGDEGKSPSTLVQETVDRIIAVVERLPGKEQTKERRADIRKVIDPRFDFRQMAISSLGPSWNTITPEEQTKFTDVFSELLAKTYLARIENVRKGMVKVTGETTENPRSIVRTNVNHEGEIFPINYKLMLTPDAGWRVYDVVIENIGLVANYRNEFSAIIRRDGFPGLMERLINKNNKMSE